MRQFYVLIFGLLCLSGQSQIINFPDPDFKAAILAFDPSLDTNEDGEISQQEAAAAGEIYANGPTIDNLDGIQYFTNLYNVYISNTSVTTIVLPPHGYNEISIGGNQLLTSFDTGIVGGVNFFSVVNNDALQTLTIGGLTTVTNSFSISGNAVLQTIAFPSLESLGSGMEFTISDNAMLASIDISALQTSTMDFSITQNPSLTSLDLSDKSFSSATIEDNGLTSINLENTYFEYSLSLADNQLASLDLSTLDAYEYSYLNLSGNNYTELDFTGPWSQLGTAVSNSYPALMLDHTQLTAINFDQPIHLSDLTITNNLQLGSISFRNGDFETCAGGYCSIGFVSASNNPALQLVCTDEFEGYALEPQFYVSGPDWVHQYIDPDVAVSTNCFYEPPGAYNTASGIIRYDADADGCSAADAPMQFAMINGIGYQNTAFSNAQGAFTAYTTAASITLTPNVNTAYFTVTPASQTYTFSGSGDYQTADFCVSPNGPHNDLRLFLSSTNSVRPGFEANYQVSVRNEGTVAQTSSLDIAFGPEMTFVSASVAPTSTSTGNLHWDLASISPLQTMGFQLKMLANTPTATPPLNSGNIVSLQGNLIGLADETPTNNHVITSQTVVNSYDPNEKIVAQGDVVLVGAANADGLTYTVHFQNLGTAAASRVVINDVLDSDFNANSFQMVASSHPCKVRRMYDRVEFWFEDIELAPASQNEAASQGFVTYSIKGNLADDTGVTYNNTADIFFDYNTAITTNTTETATILLSTPEAHAAQFRIYPNPASEKVNVISLDGLAVKAQLFNLSGQLLMETEEAPELSVDVSKLSTGTYLVTLVSENRKETRKLVKL